MTAVKGRDRNEICGGCGNKLKHCACSRWSKLLGNGGKKTEVPRPKLKRH